MQLNGEKIDMLRVGLKADVKRGLFSEDEFKEIMHRVVYPDQADDNLEQYQLVDIKQVQRLMCESESSVRRMISRGELPGRMIGGKWKTELKNVRIQMLQIPNDEGLPIRQTKSVKNNIPPSPDGSDNSLLRCAGEQAGEIEGEEE